MEKFQTYLVQGENTSQCPKFLLHIKGQSFCSLLSLPWAPVAVRPTWSHAPGRENAQIHGASVLPGRGEIEIRGRDRDRDRDKDRGR